jgi:hypothetical protein
MYDTAEVPGRDDPQVPIPGSSILPDEVPGRADNWITRGGNDGKASNRPNRRQMCPAQHQWNGELKTFENYAFNLSGWAMQSLMGYLFDPNFTQEYRRGGWELAKYTTVAVGISDARFSNRQHEFVWCIGEFYA